MASTYSSRLRIELIGTGEQSGTWGVTTNTNLGTLIEEAIAGVAAITMTDANYTLTEANGAQDESRQMVLQLSGALTATRDVICPAVQKVYIVKNLTSGGQSIVLKTSAGTGITVPNGKTTLVYCDGTNVVTAIDDLSSLSLSTLLLPTATVPAQTAEGSVVWDTNDDLLTVGTGAGRKIMVDLDSSQTLTNKTLTSPTVNAGALNGNFTSTGLNIDSNTLVVDATNNRVAVGSATPAVKFEIVGTDAALLPVGTTGQRPTGATGYIRFNTDLTSFEGYNGSAWTSVGGGATGAGTDKIFWENGQTVTGNYTISAGFNAGTFGPVSIASGVVVTVPSGSVWTVV